MKNDMKEIPAAVPTMMFGTELISVRSPPTLVSSPSISRNPNNLSDRPSFPRDTALNDPMMIMAVTLVWQAGISGVAGFDACLAGSIGASNILNPGGGHPASWVYTPAAQVLFGPDDASCMGGSTWTDHGDGTFTSAPVFSSRGFAWHELYLMGLADPSEVADWYYIRNPDPELPDAYWPGDDVTVKVRKERRDLEFPSEFPHSHGGLAQVIFLARQQVEVRDAQLRRVEGTGLVSDQDDLLQCVRMNQELQLAHQGGSLAMGGDVSGETRRPAGDHQPVVAR